MNSEPSLPENTFWTLTAQRTAVAAKAFVGYEFGELVDAGGWEYTAPGDEWTRAVYVRTDEDTEKSQKLVFTVKFEPKTASLADVYASDSKGNVWGKAQSERDVYTQGKADRLLSQLPSPMALSQPQGPGLDQMQELYDLAVSDAKMASQNGVDLNPFSTTGARNLWQQGWDGVRPANLTEGSPDWRCWGRGCQARSIAPETENVSERPRG